MEPKRIIPPSLEEIPGVADQLIDHVATNHAKQVDDAMLLALQKYLPQVTRANIVRYADRISRVQEEEYPDREYYYLDYGVPGQRLFFVTGKSLVEFDGNTARVTLQYRAI